uniref:Uncharacterized protein LOC116286842 n=1 Tax=Actinia tenebrosa TaxID=6105 RepID=A0A6P8GYK1_ACTTE
MAIQILRMPHFLPLLMAILFLDNLVKVDADCHSTPVGLENMYIIPNISFTASSFYDNKYIPYNARLNGYNGWSPKLANRENEYLQVDLGYPYVICAIATQGSSLKTEWVTQYRIMTSVYGTEWVAYKENSQVKNFTGNTDQNTIVKNRVNKPLARYVRIFPTKYRIWSTMRIELFGYPEACDNLPLGMESDVLQNITASSGQDPAKNARLNYTSGSSWCASTSDSDPYLQIDLGSFHLFCAVATQGNSMADQWVKTYQINTSTDGTTWTTYQENNIDRVFWGNFDRSTVVRQVLFYGTVLRYIRIIPKTHQTTPCLRTEIYGYQVNQTCSSHSLGIPSSKRVLNHRISTTSYYNSEHQPSMGRLGSDSAWGPEKQKGDDYLQIDVGAVSYMCSIASQGNGNNKLHEWVTKYEVLYSTTNNQYITYSENGTDKEFPGNTDQSTIVTNSIKNPFKAKFIRIRPKDFNRWKSIRVDFKGLSAACGTSLGLENSHIPDSRITSSSSLDNSHAASHGRLYGSSSWCSSSSSNTEYIQVDLGEAKTVTGIATQGDKDLDKWVTSYKMGYSFDNRYWYKYKEEKLIKVFNGNKNRTDVIVNWLSNPTAARYVKIFPQSSNGGVCLRLDLYGCTFYTPEKPSTPVTADKKSASLRWTNIQTNQGTADSFSIVVSDTYGTNQTIIVPNQPTTSKEITNLKPYTNYEAKIIGVRNHGQPLWQSTSRFRTLIAEPEASPAIETLIAISSRSIKVTIKFTQRDELNGPLAGYRILYRPEGGEEMQTDVGIVTMVTLTNLKKYTVYSISVAVKNTMFVGPASVTKQKKTLEDVPEIGPKNTRAKKVNATTCLVTWQPLTDKQSNGVITKYEIIWHLDTNRPQSNAARQEFLTASTKESQFRIEKLKPNEKYTVLVRGYTSVGPGPNSTVSFLTNTSKTKSSTSSLCTSEGNAITLGCLTSNEQTGSVRFTWTKNDVVVDDDSASKIEGNKLVLKSVKDEDFGTYVCNATNSEKTVTFTTSRHEVKECSDAGVSIMYFILPLLSIIVVMVICIAYLICRLRRNKENSEAQNLMADPSDNQALESDVSQVQSSSDAVAKPLKPPEQVTQDDSQSVQNYAQVSLMPGGTSTVYETLDDAARAAKEEANKETKTTEYMELQPVIQPAYESLHRGEESQAPAQHYEKIPGYENLAKKSSYA